MDSARGERLRACRRVLGLTQEQAAEVGGVHRNTQRAYEKGEQSPDADYLARLAAHGADLLWIITGAGEPCRAPVSAKERTSLDSLRQTAEAILAYDAPEKSAPGRLTNMEAELVHSYRALPDPDRAVVERMVTALAATKAA